MAVQKAASAAGFGIGIVDDRETFANAGRFPMASTIHTSYEDAFTKIIPARQTTAHRGSAATKKTCACWPGRCAPNALYRHDWKQAQSFVRLQGAKTTAISLKVRTRLRTDGPGKSARFRGRDAVSIVAELIPCAATRIRGAQEIEIRSRATVAER